MRVYFTEQQADAIIDRLDAYDAIADALGISGVEDNTTFTCSIDLLASGLKTDRSISMPLTDMEKAILSDCIEGSTWVAHYMDGPYHNARSRGSYRTLTNAAAKLRELGVEINIIPSA